MATATVHTLLLPWSAQGHIAPVMQLAEVLATQAGFITTIVYSARTNARLQGAASPGPRHPNMTVEVINDGLNTDPLHTPSLEETMASIPIMQEGLEKLLGELMERPHPVTCLISGTFCPWTQPIAKKFNIPRVELWSSLASIYCLGFYHHLLVSEGFVPWKGGRREDTWITCIPGLPPMRASDYPKELMPAEAETDPERIEHICKFVKNAYGNAGEQYRVLVNSIYELESSAFDALNADRVQACAIGPVFLHNLSNTEIGLPFKQPRTSMYKEDNTCLQWLDGKAHASTLYIAFGSDSKMAKDDMQELAYGLEASGQSFLWVIRPGSLLGESSIDDVLPEGFQERTLERGLVVSWAPQTAVLAHSSIGGFLSHCGWNSTLETLWLGVPILAWPQRADQGINKKFIEEDWKVGLAVEKNEEGRVMRASIEKAVGALMQGEQGSHAREKVKEYKELMARATQEGGSSRTNLEKFINDLRHFSTTQDNEKCSPT